MKQIWREIGIAALMGLVVPGVLLGAVVALESKAPEDPVIRETIPETVSSEEVYVPVLSTEGEVTRMKLNDYLTGVILAEIPADFESEAKKAQAVVARTYTIRANERRTKHEAAAVCTDSACCQGYISPENYLASGGTQEAVDQAGNAVTETGMNVLTFEGELIEATYFSCSGGHTEDAVAVWGTDVPYLRATQSPGEEYAAHYTDTVQFTPEEFASLLALELKGDPDSWFGPVTYTAGGGVNTMIIGGISFEGTVLRKILNLRSTAFSIHPQENQIIVTTRGYGHRVGMSQYGADAMAASGSGYEEILAHYYQGTSLAQWDD